MLRSRCQFSSIDVSDEMNHNPYDIANQQRMQSLVQNNSDEDDLTQSDEDDTESDPDLEHDEKEESDKEPEKDETELELERAVFGEATEFRKELESVKVKPQTHWQSDEEEQDHDVHAVDDADVSASLNHIYRFIY